MYVCALKKEEIKLFAFKYVFYLQKYIWIKKI